MDDEFDLSPSKPYDKFDGYKSLGILVFAILTLPVSLPVWLYIRLVHHSPSRRIRKLFASQRPDDLLLEVHIDNSFGQRIVGHMTTRDVNLLRFEYHRELDLLTIRLPQ